VRTPESSWSTTCKLPLVAVSLDIDGKEYRIVTHPEKSSIDIEVATKDALGKPVWLPFSEDDSPIHDQIVSYAFRKLAVDQHKITRTLTRTTI
jgi:hypothetical protein